MGQSPGRELSLAARAPAVSGSGRLGHREGTGSLGVPGGARQSRSHKASFSSAGSQLDGPDNYL